MILGSELITAQNDRDFSSGTRGNWTESKDGAGTLTYDGTNPGGEKVGKLESSGDTYLLGRLTDTNYSTPTYNVPYRLKANIYVPSANTLKTGRVRISGTSSGTADLNVKLLTADQWNSVAAFFIPVAATTAIRVGFYGNPADGDILYFDDVSLKQASTSNPMVFDGTVISSTFLDIKRIRLIQWVDHNADIPDNGALVMIINGITVRATVQRGGTPDGDGAVLWQMGPFDYGIPVKDFAVTYITHGSIHVWV